MTKLDESRTELCTKQHPSKDENRNQRGFHMRWAEESREEAGFYQHRLPAERIKCLSNVDDGEVEDPKNQPGSDGCPNGTHLRNAQNSHDRHRNAGPCDGVNQSIRIMPMKNARGAPEADGPQKRGYWLKTILAQQRLELAQYDDEGNEVKRGQCALEGESQQTEAVEVGHMRWMFLPYHCG